MAVRVVRAPSIQGQIDPSARGVEGAGGIHRCVGRCVEGVLREGGGGGVLREGGGGGVWGGGGGGCVSVVLAWVKLIHLQGWWRVRVVSTSGRVGVTRERGVRRRVGR